MLQLLQPLLLFLNNNLSVADNTAPDPTTGLCADGSQPQPSMLQLSPATAPVPEQQLVCTDNTAPDPTTGLCADGSQPQPSMLQLFQPLLLFLNNNLSVLIVLHLTQPPASVLMVHNHNHSMLQLLQSTGVTTAEQQLVCTDSTCT